MKNISLITIILSVLAFGPMVQSAEASKTEDYDHAFAESITNMMIEQFKKSLEQSAEEKALVEIAKQGFGANISKEVSGAMTAYSLYKNLKDYQDANSEVARYNAAGGFVGTVFAYTGFPEVQYAFMGQQLQSSLVQKHFAYELMDIRTEILKTEAQRIEIIKAEFLSDARAIKYLLDQITAYDKLVTSAITNSRSICENDLSNGGVTENCFVASFATYAVLTRQAHVMNDLLLFQSRVINLADLFARNKIDLKVMAEHKAEIDASLAGFNKSFTALMAGMVTTFVSNAQVKMQNELAGPNCRLEIRRSFVAAEAALNVKVEFAEDQAQSRRAAAAPLQRAVQLMSSCPSQISTFDTRMVNLISRQLLGGG